MRFWRRKNKEPSPQSAAKVEPAPPREVPAEILKFLGDLHHGLAAIGNTDGLTRAEFIEKYTSLLAEPAESTLADLHRVMQAEYQRNEPFHCPQPHRKGNGMLAQALPPYKQRRLP